MNPHGAIERRIIEHPEFEQFLSAAADFAIALPNNSQIWLPGSEPKTITRRREYKFAVERMKAGGKYFLLIGYSFGRQRDGRIDDAESFELLEGLKRADKLFETDQAAIAELLQASIGNGSGITRDTGTAPTPTTQRAAADPKRTRALQKQLGRTTRFGRANMKSGHAQSGARRASQHGLAAASVRNCTVAFVRNVIRQARRIGRGAGYVIQ